MSLAREVNVGEPWNVLIDLDDVSITLPGIEEESTNMRIDLNEISVPHAGECSTQVDLNEVADPGQFPILGWMK
ncbi:hypothetical protein LINPERHAP2_LOCUS18840 [Linum perenne]